MKAEETSSILEIETVDGSLPQWEKVAEGVEKAVLRAKPGENRVLIRMAAGSAFPHHSHSVPDEVFVVEGIYIDPHVKSGQAFGPGSYLYYPPGTEHHATTSTGCTILVWNSNQPKAKE
jgi:anti-sigma factor ChrR (cupin superfamily)